jgi:SDR family mycofactocin-dependent oxidoreductase
MPTYDFTDTVAFVTGAGRGQGRSHALAYAEHGADVVVTDACAPLETVPYDLSSRADLDETAAGVEERGGRALALEMDVRDEAAVETAVGRALEEFGRIDVLANNAGVNSSGMMLEMDEATFEEMIDTNLKGMWLVAKHVGGHMVERGGGGKIVNTASNFAFTAAPGMGHYVASKHGVMGLTKTLALELAEHGINVNAVSPTAVDTDLIHGMMAEVGEEMIESVDELAGPSNLFNPDDPLIEAQDVTEAFLWLSSDAARFVTGTHIAVDAGYMAK